MIGRAYAYRLAETVIDKYIKVDIIHEFDVLSKSITQQDGVCGRIIREMWDKLMSNYKGWEKGGKFLLPEKAMACLLRRGLPQEAIRLNQPSATIRLKNLEYIITKQGAAFTAYPRVFVGMYGPLPPMRWVTLSGDEFAEFLFDFDEIADEICAIVEDRVLQRKVRSMQYRILRETVDRLGEQYLAPAGITWQVGENFTDDNVTLIFRHSSIPRGPYSLASLYNSAAPLAPGPAGDPSASGAASVTSGPSRVPAASGHSSPSTSKRGRKRQVEKVLVVDVPTDHLAEVIPLIPDRMTKGNK